MKQQQQGADVHQDSVPRPHTKHDALADFLGIADLLNSRYDESVKDLLEDSFGVMLTHR